MVKSNRKSFLKLSCVSFVFFILFLYYAHIINFVRGNSMSPTLSSGDILVVDVFVKKFNVGDIIVFRKNNITYVKRIVADFGFYTFQDDTGEFDADPIYYYYSPKAYTDLSKMRLDSTVRETLMSSMIHLSDQYWVEGDSKTSTNSDVFGPVRLSEIIGKVIFVQRI